MTNPTKRISLARESLVIAVIGLCDLLTTLLWVRSHGAQEANPFFAHYLAMGSIWFILMKFVMLACPIFLLEWARMKSPHFTRRASRFAIGAYVGLYVIGFVRLNPAMFRPHAAEAEVFPTVKTRIAAIGPATGSYITSDGHHETISYPTARGNWRIKPIQRVGEKHLPCQTKGQLNTVEPSMSML